MRSLDEQIWGEMVKPSALLSMMLNATPPLTPWQRRRLWIRNHIPYFHVSWGYKDWERDWDD